MDGWVSQMVAALETRDTPFEFNRTTISIKISRAAIVESNASMNAAEIQDRETAAYPDGSMGSLPAELAVLFGFVSAFILVFIIFVIGFKCVIGKEDAKLAEKVAQGQRSMVAVTSVMSTWQWANGEQQSEKEDETLGSGQQSGGGDDDSIQILESRLMQE